MTKLLIEAGALRQFQHNDGSGLTAGYDIAIADREFARVGVQARLEQTMVEKRIELIPEYEGEWRARVYLDSDEPQATATGSTPSAAVKAVMACIDGTTQGAQGDGNE